jgi:hypothetical protein
MTESSTDGLSLPARSSLQDPENIGLMVREARRCLGNLLLTRSRPVTLPCYSPGSIPNPDSPETPMPRPHFIAQRGQHLFSWYHPARPSVRRGGTSSARAGSRRSSCSAAGRAGSSTSSCTRAPRCGFAASGSTSDSSWSTARGIHLRHPRRSRRCASC